jgi:hypothetical protein
MAATHCAVLATASSGMDRAKALAAFAAASAVRRSHWNGGDHVRCGEATDAAPSPGPLFFARRQRRCALRGFGEKKPGVRKRPMEQGVSSKPLAGRRTGCSTFAVQSVSACVAVRRNASVAASLRGARPPPQGVETKIVTHSRLCRFRRFAEAAGLGQWRRGWSSSEAPRRPRSSPRALRPSPRTGASRSATAARGGAW